LIRDAPLKVETRIVWIEAQYFVKVDDGTIKLADSTISNASIGKGIKIQWMGLQDLGPCADPKLETSVSTVLPIIGSRNCR
jgi:hypothetical protein